MGVWRGRGPCPRDQAGGGRHHLVVGDVDFSEAQARLETALSLAKSIACDDLLRAKLACALGWSSVLRAQTFEPDALAWLDATAFARRAGDVEYQQRALVGFAFYLLQIGQIPRAITYLEEATALADRDRDLTATSEADRAWAWAHAFAGELGKSRLVLDRLAATHSLAEGQSRKDANEVYRFITVRFNLPFVAWMQGQAEYAAKLANDAVEAADRGGHWVSQSNALGLAALPISLENGNLAALEHYAERLRCNLDRERISRWIPVERYFSACLRDLRGDLAAVEDIRAAIEELIDCRFLMRIGSYLGILSRAYLRQGRIEGGAEGDHTRSFTIRKIKESAGVVRSFSGSRRHPYSFPKVSRFLPKACYSRHWPRRAR